MVEHEVGFAHQIAGEQPGAVAAQVEPVLQTDQVGALRHRRPSHAPVPGGATPSPGRCRARRARAAAAPRPSGCGRCSRCRRRGCACQNSSGVVHGASAPGGAPQLRARDRALAHQPRHRAGAVHQCRRRDVAQHAAVEHQQLALRSIAAAKARDIRSAPGAGGSAGTVGGGRRQRLAECRDQPRDARDAMYGAPRCPPPGPRSSSGSRPSPPGSTSVSGPGQNASDSARAARPNTRPHASAIGRPETSSRNGLPGGRPLSRASAREPPPRSDSSPGRRRFRWDRRAARPARRCAPDDRDRGARPRRRSGTEGSPLRHRERLGQREIVARS